MRDRPSVCFFNTSPSMPHILLGDGPQQAGGAEVRACLLAAALVERGYKVSFAVHDYGQPREIITDRGIRVVAASGKRRGTPLLRLLTQTLPADLRAIRRIDADVYIEMGVSWRTGMLSWLCRSQGRRFLLWLASITDPCAAVKGKSRVPRHARLPAQYGLRHADVVIAQTREQQALMRDLHGRDCPVIPNIWVATPAGEEKASPPEVLWAARYLPLKRPEWALEVARRLPDIRFRLAGGAAEGHEDLLDRTREAAKDLPNVEVMGFVPFVEMDKLYARASALLCTSTIEGFPNTFLQAWNHRTPVVSTIDPDHVLTENGIGVACKDVDELAAGIRRVCGPEGRVMGARAREYLERVHSVEAVMALFEPLLYPTPVGSERD